VCQLPDVFIFKTPSKLLLAQFHKQNRLSCNCSFHAVSRKEGVRGADVGRGKMYFLHILKKSIK
jgi:hypothetical protein